MKNNQVTFILAGVFLLAAFAAAGLGQWYNTTFSREQEAEIRIARMKFTQVFANQLLNDVVAYSKTNPAILPLIQSATNSSVPAPTVKPPAK